MRVWRYIDEVARAGSVRQAAERLYVTPSALLRRIQDVESDLGTPIFERSAAGMQLTSAGEIFINWIRNQNADLRRVYSEIEALSGLRRGEVRISPSQAVARGFLLREIVSFRSRHPMVNFKVTVSDHGKAMRALLTYDTDLILVFRPPQAAELQPLMSIGQGLVAVMANDHPLAQAKTLRLRDCLSYDVALPDSSFSGREIIDEVLARSSMRLKPVMEVNSFELLVDLVKDSQIITFQIDIGTLHWKNDPKLAIVPIDAADAAHGPLVLGQLKGRMLPLAVAKFAEQLSRSLDDLRTMPTMQGQAGSEKSATAA
jgi:DNA-binding transcriptional LysR family regulator